jgi:predicted DNA-binding protein (MmcQ/YjbR family)
VTRRGTPAPRKSPARRGKAAVGRKALRAEDVRLRRLSAICRALPETERLVRDDHADFRVRGKVYAYFLNDHHGDGIVSVCCRSALGENTDRVRRDPGRFYLPAYIGARGWFGLRLDRGAIDWREVQNVIELSYCLAAPRTLQKALAVRRDGEVRSARD